MKKFRKSVGLALLTVAASTLAACGKKGGKDVADNYVNFWSSFGSTYKNALNGIVDEIEADTGLDIEHTSQGSYPEIRKEMISAIAVGDFPNIAMGYPDHFASYLGSDVLYPYDEFLTEEDLNDYYPEYMVENHMNDRRGQEHIFGIPFNKSTELLGYNGVFVDYCATQNAELANIPATWDEWAVQGPKYNTIFQNLIASKKGLYGIQDNEGKATEFELVTVDKTRVDDDGDICLTNGKKLLIDFSSSDASLSRLFSWDATDNAFITLVRQWGAKYTVLPEDQKPLRPTKRIGQILFRSPENLPKVVDCLKFFNRLAQVKIFGTPNDLGSDYSSSAFELGRCMFMVCSSGGLSYNTTNWHHRFRVAPIPYKDANHKYVISQGANICLTTAKGNKQAAYEVVKQLTRGKYQTEWCLTTGYYPASKSAAESEEYKAFLNEAVNHPETAYNNPTRVAYREGSELNTNVYMKSDEKWNKFVDDAFIGSAVIREVVKDVLNNVFVNIKSDIENDNKYIAELDNILANEQITSSKNIQIVK